jgi:hypothetical protein
MRHPIDYKRCAGDDVGGVCILAAGVLAGVLGIRVLHLPIFIQFISNHYKL